MSNDHHEQARSRARISVNNHAHDFSRSRVALFASLALLITITHSLLWDDSYSLLTIDDDEWIFTRLKIITTYFLNFATLCNFYGSVWDCCGGWIGTQLVHSNAREKPTHPLTSSALEETRSVCCCVVQFCRCINQFLIQQGACGKMAAKINYRLGAQARPK